jgi:hypothetical protein
MDREQDKLRRYSETTDRLYFCLIGLGVSSVGVLWTIIIDQLIGCGL